jgi:hypothetical protein
VTPDRWRQINDLFHKALEQDAASREPYVRRAAADDPELLEEVLTLLSSHQRASGLDLPAWAVAADLILEDESVQAGQKVGRYRVVRAVASGGMGVVYHATDEVLGRSVALKALPAEYAKDKTRRDRLVREAKLAAQINHRAIATVYELVEADDHIYIASEFVPGITLRRELEDGPLTGGHLVGTLLEIASALAAAHAHNIVHRDLKPENIVRREDGQIKVLDFGLARTASSSGALPTSTRFTEAGIVAGTPGYIAPEVLSNREADARSDIFVFGLLAWELATGRHPLGSTANSQMARLHDISAGQEPSLSGSLPVAGLERIIRQCMRRAPDERYASTDLLVEDLRSLQRSRPAIEPPAPASTLWWWRFHQGTTAAVDVATPVFAWMARSVVKAVIPGPLGTWLFYAVLAAATTAVTLRLNLLFTSRVHPQMLDEHHAQLYKWIVRSEAALVILLLVIAGIISEVQEAGAALLLTLAIVIAALLAIIEPATSRGAGLR